MLTLDEIAIKYDADKSSPKHNYTPIYEELLEPLRHERVNVLELGVWQGASLLTWGDYFDHPDAMIVGVDINLGTYSIGVCAGPYVPFRQRFGPPKPGVSAYLGDQTEVPPPLAGWRPDIVIDDASHLSSKTIASFHTWWPILKPGGYYFVEDVNTSYIPWIFGENESHPDPDQPPRLRPEGQTAMQFLRRLTDELQSDSLAPPYRLGLGIKWLWFHPNLVVVRKQLDGPDNDLPR